MVPPPFLESGVIGHGKSLSYPLHAAEIDPGTIKLEVTESVLMDDPETTLEVLRDLKGLGVELAVATIGERAVAADAATADALEQSGEQVHPAAPARSTAP